MVLVSIMGVIKIKYGYREVENQNKNIPTVTINNDYPLEKELPYYGKGFIVEKYTAPKTLKMILNGATETEASKAVTSWINSFGDAIGVHKIIISN